MIIAGFLAIYFYNYHSTNTVRSASTGMGGGAHYLKPVLRSAVHIRYIVLPISNFKCAVFVMSISSELINSLSNGCPIAMRKKPASIRLLPLVGAC